MGPLRLSLALATAIVVTGCSSPAEPSSEPSTTREAEIARIGDGDSFLLADGREVRLLQVDAPELNPDCFGRESKRVLERLLPRGQDVELERDPRLDNVDRYGRLLRYVWVGDLNVNVEMVARGAASPYFFRKERGRYADELVTAAKDARSARDGLWGACPRAELNTGLGSVTGPASSQGG